MEHKKGYQMSSILNNVGQNKLMLEGSYKKLKSYYYYNKNFLFIRKKVAEFEYDLDEMDKKFTELSEFLANPNSKNSKDLLKKLVSMIDFYILPKSFHDIESKTSVVSNALDRNKQIKKVNFFIDIPIELHILDTLWTILLGKISFDQNILTSSCYGNTLNNYALYNFSDNLIESINFENNRLFSIYFYKYTNWKNNAFDQMGKNYREKHSLLISLDIKSYYYSVKFDFGKLNSMFNSDENLNSIEVLTKIFSIVYGKYTEIIKPYRKDLNDNNEKGLPLPIGLFSSMLLGNIYLSEFDKKVLKSKNISYYGRYVDDILFVFAVDKVEDTSIKSVIKNNLINNELLRKVDNNNYALFDKSNLLVQNSKIKIIHIDPSESKTIIDVYNKNIRVVPSQMNVIPDYELDITDFEESAYIVENLTQEKKLREIGNMSIDGFKVSRYLSALVQKQKSIIYKDTEDIANIEEQIKKIYKFFSGNQSIEFYSNWLNILYFFMLKGNKKEFAHFCKILSENIKKLKFKSLDDETKYKRIIGKKVKQSLNEHLEICICTAFALRSDLLKIAKYQVLTDKLQKSNMFNHYLTSYPLINYIDNKDKPIPLATVKLKELSKFERDISSSFKIKWSPRFIKLEELFMYWFTYKFDFGGNIYITAKPEANKVQEIIERFYKINGIRSEHIDVKINREKILDRYIVQNIIIRDTHAIPRSRLRVAVANIKMSKIDCANGIQKPWATLTPENKRELFHLLRQAYGNGTDKVHFLILPEFYLPLKWLSEIVDFSRKSQIAIITGLQYLTDSKKNAFNYIATVLPFEDHCYKNAFLLIREKNDYSPLEKVGLAEMGYTCNDAQIPTYQVYNWKKIDFGTFLCYEFTDVVARCLYKAKVDMLFTPEFNSDTSYFSNIIETSVRDLHTMIVQANTSIYGDSRITGPYSRDQRNIVQIKGGDNNGLIIGTINLLKLQQYQAYYDSKLIDQINTAKKKLRSKRINRDDKRTSDGIKISKLPARYDTRRVKNKLS